MLTVGSLFSGIEGIGLGLERTNGFRVVWHAESDPHCQRVLARHWPHTGRWDDVRTFPPHPAEDWQCDVICGGDPCQENSGARQGDYTSQQSLGGEFIRVVNAIRPRLVLRENPAHVRKDAPWPWWRFRTALESLGYACVPFRLRACCVGAFHQRERVFLLAERADAKRDRLEGWETPKDQARHLVLHEGLVDFEEWNAVYASRGFGSRAGLPDYVDRMRACGNAVVPAVAQYIGERILEAARC